MKRFSLDQVQTSELFYRVPKSLFKSEKYSAMKAETKMAYAILKDRFELSIKNGWVDDNNDVYLIFTNTELGQQLNVSQQKVIKIKKELEEFGLLEQVRQGLNKPNRLYIGNVEAELISEIEPESESKTPAEAMVSPELPNRKFQNFQNGSSRTTKSEVQELPNWKSNDTENNYTENNDIRDDEDALRTGDPQPNNQSKIENVKQEIDRILIDNPEIEEVANLFGDLIVEQPKQALEVIQTLVDQYWSLRVRGDQGNTVVKSYRKSWGPNRGESKLLREAASQQIKYMTEHLADANWYGQYFSTGLEKRITTLTNVNPPQDKWGLNL